jgi:asparagine synthase (glutamine-hydrolysing)
MASSDGRYVTVFNGEIYNHVRLRSELESAGACLVTNCDTEVLPYLYSLHGPAMVERLVGMFAFAILDLRERTVFIARDRLGKKPLYWRAGANGIAFASTADALLPLLPSAPDPDPQTIAEYMILQYVPSSRSPWEGVSKLEPGHWLRWKDGVVEQCRYWTPPLPGEADVGVPSGEEIRALVRESVAERLESEVPLGVFLSGGLDSSIVVAEMAEIGAETRTFSVGFTQAGFDESAFSKQVAERFGTEHHHLRIEPDIPELFEQLSRAYDEPFADSSALATLGVAQAASEHVTVVLTGDGGDELFGGYDRYRALSWGSGLRSRFGRVATPAAVAGKAVGRISGVGLLEAASGFVSDPWVAYRDHLFHFSPGEIPSVLRPEMAERVDPWESVRRLDRLWERLSEADDSPPWVPWVDAQTYLPDDLLTKMDRATMAFGVEARSPLLDHRLWERAAGIPRRRLLDRRQGKLLLRAAYTGILPDAVLTRPKQGFGVPIADWLRSRLRPRVDELLLSADGPLHWLLRRDAVDELVRRFMQGDDGFTTRVWNLTALGAWYQARSLHRA